MEEPEVQEDMEGLQEVEEPVVLEDLVVLEVELEAEEVAVLVVPEVLEEVVVLEVPEALEVVEDMVDLEIIHQVNLHKKLYKESDTDIIVLNFSRLSWTARNSWKTRVRRLLE